MRTIDLLFLSQVNSLDVMFMGVGKHVFVLGICLLHVPVEGRGREHRFDRLKRSVARLGINQEDDNNPNKVQGGEEEVGSALWMC